MDAPPGSPKEDLAVLRELYEATNGYRWKVVWDLDQARTSVLYERPCVLFRLLPPLTLSRPLPLHQGWRDYVFHGVEVNDELRVCRIALRRNKLV